MSRAVFISDLHISSAADPKLDLLKSFLDKCALYRVNDLFLVGDIFDLWIADRAHFTKTYSDVIAKLTHLKTLGITIHYFEGNHDLDLKLYWEEQLGFDVQESAAHYRLGDLEVRVEHGDQMDPSDRGYLFLRWFLRTGFMRFMGRHLPDGVVRWIGRRASHASRDYTTQVKVVSEEQVRAKIHAHARRAYQVKPFDLLVTGHVHVAEDRVLDGKFRCIGLGTWLKEALVLDVQGANVRLIRVEDF